MMGAIGTHTARSPDANISFIEAARFFKRGRVLDCDTTGRVS